MPPTVAAAFPFIEVSIDTSALQPTAQRSPGVIAVVGASTAGDAAANVPSGGRHKYCNLSSFFRARVTFSRMSEAVAVQMNGLGCSLWPAT